METVDGMMKLPQETNRVIEISPQVEPWDNADYGSDSEADSYDGTLTTAPPEVLRDFTKDDLLEFEKI